jgi:hypothetical protein
MRFSLFRTVPGFFREAPYDQGEWLIYASFTIGNNEITQLALDNYVLLDMLPEITAVNDSGTNTPDLTKYTWKIRQDYEWLRVRDNIFDPANWERAEE